jgi:hypothetical protein
VLCERRERKSHRVFTLKFGSNSAEDPTQHIAQALLVASELVEGDGIMLQSWMEPTLIRIETPDAIESFLLEIPMLLF